MVLAAQKACFQVRPTPSATYIRPSLPQHFNWTVITLDVVTDVSFGATNLSTATVEAGHSLSLHS
jgi:hypothetical protein